MTNDRSPSLPTPSGSNTPGLGGARRVLHLAEQLHSDDETIQQAAAFQLAELGDVRAVEHLHTLIIETDDLYFLNRVLLALAHIQHSEACEVLLDVALETDHPILRETTAYLLRSYPLNDVLRRTQRALQGQDEDLQFRVIEILKHLPAEATREALLAFVNQAGLSDSVLVRTCRALAIYPTEAVFAVLSAYLLHASKMVRASAVLALWRQNMPQTPTLIYEAFADEVDADVRNIMMTALAHIGTQSMLRNLFDNATAVLNVPIQVPFLVANGGEEVLLSLGTPAALRALIEKGAGPSKDIANLLQEDSYPHLLATLDAPSEHALHIVEELSEPLFIPQLIRLIERHHEAGVRLAALRAFTQIDDPRVSAYLPKVLRSRNDEMRLIVLEPLARRGVDITSHCMDMLLNPTSTYREHLKAITCLELLGKVDELLHVLENNTNHGIGNSIRASLSKFDDPRVHRRLIEDLEGTWALQSARSLAQLGKSEGVEVLFNEIKRHPEDPFLLLSVCASLKPLARQDEQIMAFIIDCATTYPSSMARSDLIKIVAELNNSTIASELVTNELDTYLDVTRLHWLPGAVKALREPNTLLQALGAWHADIRLAAVQALAGCPPTDAITEALTHLLTHEPQFKVRQAATDVLGSTDDGGIGGIYTA